MLEKPIEQHLVREVKKIGGTAYKFTSPGRRSVPDRLCLFPFGIIVFVELKATGKKPTKKQLREHNRLRALGFGVYVSDSKYKNSILIDTIRRKLDEKRRDHGED